MKNGYWTALVLIGVGGLVLGVVFAGLAVPFMNVLGSALIGLGTLALVAFLSVGAILRGFGRTTPEAPTAPIAYPPMPPKA